jgi:hypothetical protein
MRRALRVCVVSTAAAYYVLYTLSKEIFHKFRRIVVFFIKYFFVVPLDLAKSFKCKYLFKPVSYTSKKIRLYQICEISIYSVSLRYILVHTPISTHLVAHKFTEITSIYYLYKNYITSNSITLNCYYIFGFFVASVIVH